MRKTLFGGLVGVLAASLVVASAAQAKPKKVKVASQVSIQEFVVTPGDGGFTLGFEGRVASRPVCRERRLVRIDKNIGGTMVAAKKDRTDAGGLWQTSFSQLTPLQIFGVWKATVRRKIVRERRNGEVRKIIICRRDVSPPFEIDP
jgi:hypothetical protein